MPKTNKHHVLPRSRGGGDGSNILIVNKKKHEAYNMLFGGNALPEEAVMILIKEWFYVEEDLRNHKLHNLVMELAKLCSSYIDQHGC